MVAVNIERDIKLIRSKWPLSDFKTADAKVHILQLLNEEFISPAYSTMYSDISLPHTSPVKKAFHL